LFEPFQYFLPQRKKTFIKIKIPGALKAFFKTDSGIYTYLDKRENDIFET
jgi:hypothetical protein